MSNITLRDIAQALNVSVSTVSKALSDSYEISEETKRRILDYAAELKYTPNRFAKSLKDGRSKSIGVVVCSIGNAVIAEMLDGIDQACYSRGYHTIIMQSKESYEQEQQCLHFLDKQSVDGILISLATETINLKFLKQLKSRNLPLVLFDRLSPDIDTHKVSADNIDGGYQATAHLIRNGYKKIGHITIRSPFSITTERLMGYKKALQENGLEYQPDYVRFCRYDTIEDLDSEVIGSVQSLMELPDPPDALFTATDLISTRCAGLITKLGYRIPQDIALIGFTNTPMADFLNPPLSTVNQPAYEIGNLAAETLISLIEAGIPNRPSETLKLPTKIHIRQSSGGHSR